MSDPVQNERSVPCACSAFTINEILAWCEDASKHLFEPIHIERSLIEDPDYGIARFSESNRHAARGCEMYRNPDARCTYPWSPGGAGYCWSFAHHVDGRKGYEDMEKICRNCTLWKPNTNITPTHFANTARKETT